MEFVGKAKCDRNFIKTRTLKLRIENWILADEVGKTHFGTLRYSIARLLETLLNTVRKVCNTNERQISYIRKHKL